MLVSESCGHFGVPTQAVLLAAAWLTFHTNHNAMCRPLLLCHVNHCGTALNSFALKWHTYSTSVWISVPFTLTHNHQSNIRQPVQQYTVEHIYNEALGEFEIVRYTGHLVVKVLYCTAHDRIWTELFLHYKGNFVVEVLDCIYCLFPVCQRHRHKREMAHFPDAHAHAREKLGTAPRHYRGKHAFARLSLTELHYVTDDKYFGISFSLFIFHGLAVKELRWWLGGQSSKCMIKCFFFPCKRKTALLYPFPLAEVLVYLCFTSGPDMEGSC